MNLKVSLTSLLFERKNYPFSVRSWLNVHGLLVRKSTITRTVNAFQIQGLLNNKKKKQKIVIQQRFKCFYPSEGLSHSALFANKAGMLSQNAPYDIRWMCRHCCFFFARNANRRTIDQKKLPVAPKSKNSFLNLHCLKLYMINRLIISYNITLFQKMTNHSRESEKRENPNGEHFRAPRSLINFLISVKCIDVHPLKNVFFEYVCCVNFVLQHLT